MKIIYNGIEYASPDAMPADARRAFLQLAVKLGDDDRNGMPDLLEAPLAGERKEVVMHSEVTINGHPCDDLSQLSPDVRRMIERTLGVASGGAAADIDHGLGAAGRRRSEPAPRLTFSGWPWLAGVLGFLLLLVLALWLAGVRPEQLLSD